jgi:hypothetical protein
MENRIALGGSEKKATLSIRGEAAAPLARTQVTLSGLISKPVDDLEKIIS